MEWISVDDILPEVGATIDVFVPDVGRETCVTLSAISATGPVFFSWDSYWDRWGEIHHITHWMPIPEPPK